MQNALNLFKALSDETRLRIANLVLERECSVCEIAQAMMIPHTRASRGLTALCNTGFLKAKRDGLWVLYSIDDERIGKSYSCFRQLIRTALEGNALSNIDKERLKTTVRESPCVKRTISLYR